MSVLTKILVVLVSLSAIFLCGVLVVFVANTANYRDIAVQREGTMKAAQVQALVAEDALRKAQAQFQGERDKLYTAMKTLEDLNADLRRNWQIEAKARQDADVRATKAVDLETALATTLERMRQTRNSIQTSLAQAQMDQLQAETQVIELTQQVNESQATIDQLESLRQQAVERNQDLETQIEKLQQRLAQVTIAGRQVEPDMDRVTSVTTEQSGVPIRGSITEVKDGLAAIDVGSASGVRSQMTLRVIRDDQYIGDVVITHVWPSYAAGRIDQRRGAVKLGDTVVSSFD